MIILNCFKNSFITVFLKYLILINVPICLRRRYQTNQKLTRNDQQGSKEKIRNLLASHTVEISRRRGMGQRGRPGSYITPEQRVALKRELLNFRRREQLIFQLLSQLRKRNQQLLSIVRDPFRQQLRRRLRFANGNRPKLVRTLSGSVTGQDMPRRRVV